MTCNAWDDLSKFLRTEHGVEVLTGDDSETLRAFAYEAAKIASAVGCRAATCQHSEEIAALARIVASVAHLLSKEASGTNDAA